MAKTLMKKSEKIVPKAPIIKPNDLEKRITELIEIVNTALPDEKNKLKFLASFGIGVSDKNTKGDYFTCPRCGVLLSRKSFYVSTEIGCESGIAPVCKDCVEQLARPEVKGEKMTPDKDSVIRALDFLRKPYLETVWEASMMEASNTVTGKMKTDVWTSYIKNIQMKNYYGKTHKDSDFYTISDFLSFKAIPELTKDQIMLEEFEKNKSDCLRLLGYLPFEQELIPDQPFLYAQLMGFLDASEEGNDDMMRTSSIISIVRCFLQESRINDLIAGISKTPQSFKKDIGTIKALHDTQQKISSHITKLAQESCISLKHSKNAKKGENTWTGKIKKVKDVNLREGEINGFDLNTCKGMQQVMELSDASIMKQLHLDESEWADMVSEQREMLRKAQNELDFYNEISRIILRENLDLRDSLKEHNLLPSKDLVDLDELYSPLLSNYKEGVILDD